MSTTTRTNNANYSSKKFSYDKSGLSKLICGNNYLVPSELALNSLRIIGHHGKSAQYTYEGIWCERTRHAPILASEIEHEAPNAYFVVTETRVTPVPA